MSAVKPKPFVWKTVACEDGSAPDGRWGHSLNLVANRYLVVSGGIQAGRIFSDTWVYDFNTRKWGRCLTSGTGPTARWGHSATQVNSHTLVILGGREGSKPAVLSEYYELNLRTMAWTKMTTAEPAPKARYAHGALMLPGTPKQLLVFGGHGGRSRYYNDTIVLCLPPEAGSGSAVPEMPVGLRPYSSQSDGGTFETLASFIPGFARQQEQPPKEVDPFEPRWYVPTLTGNPPSKRSSFSFSMVGTNAFVIGGYDGKDILKEIGILHTDSWTWSKPSVGGSGIPPLVGHTAEHIDGTNQIVVFGGGVSALELSCSIYLLDAESCSSTIFTQAVAPAARFWHKAAVHKKTDQQGAERLKMLIFGGAGESGQAYNDLLEIDVTALADGDGLGESVALGLLQSPFSLAKSADEEGAEGMRAGAVSGGPTTLRASSLSMAVGMGGVGKMLTQSAASGSVGPSVVRSSTASGRLSAASSDDGTHSSPRPSSSRQHHHHGPSHHGPQPHGYGPHYGPPEGFMHGYYPPPYGPGPGMPSGYPGMFPPYPYGHMQGPWPGIPFMPPEQGRVPPAAYMHPPYGNMPHQYASSRHSHSGHGSRDSYGRQGDSRGEGQSHRGRQ